MNKVILIGRLTRNPEIRYSQGENSLAVARFTLAVDRRFKRDNEATADFISCVAFGRTAEFFEKYTRQGSKMAVEGRIQTGSYVKQDGTKVYTTEVVVENTEFADSKPVGQGFQNQQFAQGFPAQASSVYSGFQDQNQGNFGYSQQNAAPAGYQNQPAPAPVPAPAEYQTSDHSFDGQNMNGSGIPAQNAPMQEAADEGFMQIPDELNDEGLPFG